VGQIICVGETDAGRLLVNEESSAIYLIDIALLGEYRNRGIGTHLLNDLQRECDLRQMALRLHCLAASPVRRLYRRLGLEEVGADEIYVRMERSPKPALKGVS
jgi:ribosomal protein S18 acetylase RimI-like enzyme